MVLLLSLSCRPRSAFFWLLSMLAVSTVGAIRPVRDFLPFMLPFGVLVQELFRWVYFKGYAGLCHLLKRGTPSIEFSTHEQLGIAVGKQSTWLGAAAQPSTHRLQRSAWVYALAVVVWLVALDSRAQRVASVSPYVTR